MVQQSIMIIQQKYETYFYIYIKLLKKHDFQLVVIPSMRTPINTIHYAKEFFGIIIQL